MSIFGKIYFETFKMVRMDHHPHWAGNQATTGVRLRSLVQLAHDTRYKHRDLNLLIKNILSLIAVTVGEYRQ